ncbi:hypothetical protein GDO86_004539, partial [Hymenochirus boettgeri]
FSEPDYFLLRQNHHVALSSDPVIVEYNLPNYNNVTANNIAVILLDTSNNGTIVRKQLPVIQSQGHLEFECFHFISAGLYHFQINFNEGNQTNIRWQSSILNVTWPQFHIDLNRTSNIRSFQIGIFTNEQICSHFPNQDPTMLLEVEHIHSFQELEGLNNDRFMLYKTYKEIPLSPSQWVEFECASVRPEAFITMSLKPVLSESLIAFLGPVDLVKTFRYRLITSVEQKCEDTVNVHVIPPPCNYADGKMVVYKEALRGFPDSSATLAENILQTGDKVAQFNCTLFDIGRNKYCFEFFRSSGKIYPFLGAKECVGIRREIESWSLWQSWSPCSTTCGDGERERHRECLTSSREKPACEPVRPSSKSTTHSTDAKTSSTVTITGISLCLSIIIITIVITVFRKFNKTQSCNSAVKHNSGHAVNCRKNSDEENIYQLRQSFSDMGEGLHENAEEIVSIPLTQRQSVHATEDQENVQKLIPPIFSYRLAQQQLKEMKQRGLTEATKMYHVSQSPMSDTILDGSLTLPVVSENSEDNITNKFRIQSPFLEPRSFQLQCHEDRPNAFSSYEGPSPNLTLPRLSQLKNQDVKTRHFERGYPKTNNFRRTSSFHETKYNRPFRERSLTTLSPRQTMSYNPKTRTWEYSSAERSNRKSIQTDKSPENLGKVPKFVADSSRFSTKDLYMRQTDNKPDLFTSRHNAIKVSKGDRQEKNRLKKGSPVEMPRTKEQDILPAPKDSVKRNSSLSPAHYRREKCQSFPWGTNFSFYDNTTFKLTEAEQEMIDLPGYFASNEEDETSTLSMERLVI